MTATVEGMANSISETTRGVAVDVAGIALLAPGLPNWATAAPLLRAPARWQRAPTVVPAPALLPATERRRAGTVVKASVWVAEAACHDAGLDPATLATVFTSSTGDPANCHAMCEALARPERAVSPTRFTNSVHNVAAGYWHIAAHSMQASTSLGAFDGSFAAGLLEAAAQAQATQRPVLLVACDVPYPEPLHGVRPLPDSAAVALVLAPVGQGRRALRLAPVAGAAISRCADAALETLRGEIPAARALPLLQALAGAAAVSLVLEGTEGCDLAVDLAAGPSVERTASPAAA